MKQVQLINNTDAAAFKTAVDTFIQGAITLISIGYAQVLIGFDETSAPIYNYSALITYQ